MPCRPRSSSTTESVPRTGPRPRSSPCSRGRSRSADMPVALSPTKPKPVAPITKLHTGASPFAPSDPTPAELGRRIKLLRISRGLTLKDLEERGGISATHVSEIERGKASPTVGALGRIARALDLRPATLVQPRMLPQVTVARPDERQERRVHWGAAGLEAVGEPGAGAALEP